MGRHRVPLFQQVLEEIQVADIRIHYQIGILRNVDDPGNSRFPQLKKLRTFLLKESPVFFVVKLWIHLAHVQKIPLGLRVGVDERFQPTHLNFAIGLVQRMDERSRQIHEGQTPDFFAVSRQVWWRSEEHTSELQSRQYLV